MSHNLVFNHVLSFSTKMVAFAIPVFLHFPNIMVKANISSVKYMVNSYLSSQKQTNKQKLSRSVYFSILMLNTMSCHPESLRN